MSLKELVISLAVHHYHNDKIILTVDTFFHVQDQKNAAGNRPHFRGVPTFLLLKSTPYISLETKEMLPYRILFFFKAMKTTI